MKSRIAVLGAIVLAACATASSFDYTHKGEGVGKIDFKGRKVAAVVLGLGVTQPRREVAENALAKELSARGMVGVASYTIVPNATLEPMTRERAIARLQQAGVAALVVLRVVDTDKKTVRTEWASTEYQTRLAKRDYFGPIGLEGDNYDRRITTFTIETTLSSLEPYALLWAGQSQAVNPKDVEAFIPKFAREVADELRREGLVR